MNPRSSSSDSFASSLAFIAVKSSARTGQLQRALELGNLLQAEALARELAPVPLGDALQLLNLIHTHRPDRYERAAVRWHGRFAITTSGLTLPDSRLAPSLLDAHGNSSPEALPALVELARRYRVPNIPRRRD